MGGFGSGQSTGRGVTNHCSALDVRQLHRDGWLSPGQLFSWSWSGGGKPSGSIQIHTKADSLTLVYTHRSGVGDWESKRYPVYLDWTPCNYGGRRPWLLCPASGCTRRVAILYLGWSGIFSCRHCARLSYKSQRETDVDRRVRRAEKIRDRLGWEPGVGNGDGGKPDGMHWSTFERLVAEHYRYADAAFSEMARQFGPDFM